MTFTAAAVREQGQDFVVVLVKEATLADQTRRAQSLAFAERHFGVRAALMGDSSFGTFGPADIVNWLEGIGFDQLPWHDYRIAA